MSTRLKHILEKSVLSIPKGLMSLLVTALIVYLSLDSNPFSLGKLHLFWGSDKVAHVLMYFVCAIAYLLDFAKFRFPHKTRFSQELAVTSCAIILGGMMEVAQLAIDNGRGYDPLDWLADAIGALAGFAVLHFWYLHKLRDYYYNHKYHHHRRHSYSKNK